MKTRAQLWDEKRDLWQRMDAIQTEANTRGEGRNEAEDREYDAHAARIQQIENIMRQEDEHAERARAMTEPQRSRDLSDPDDRGEGDDPLATAEYRKAHDRYLRFGERRLSAQDAALLRTAGDPEKRAMGSLVGADGGYLVPTTFANKLVETQEWYGGVLESGPEILNTATGEDIQWPASDGTALEGHIVGENQSNDVDDDPAFTFKKLGAHIYVSPVVKAPFTLVNDAQYDLEAFLARRAGTAVARVQNKHMTIGTGAGQPQGMVTGASRGPAAVTASATAVTALEIIDLEHSVDPAYRNGAKFMWHDATMANIRKLVETGTGRPLWEPSLKDGVPSTYNGRQYVINNDMPLMTASQKPILFGNYQAYYVVRRVSGLLVVRLDQLYARSLQMGYFIAERMDAGVQDSAAVKALEMHS